MKISYADIKKLFSEVITKEKSFEDAHDWAAEMIKQICLSYHPQSITREAWNKKSLDI